MTPQDTGILRTVVGGKNITNDVLCKYSPHVPTAKCPCCSCDDSRFHRLFHCAQHKMFASTCGLQPRWLVAQHQATVQLGLPQASEDILLLKQRVCGDFPDLVLPAETSSKRIFSDGTCFFNNDRTFAISGYAIRQVVGSKSSLLEKALCLVLSNRHIGEKQWRSLEHSNIVFL